MIMKINTIRSKIYHALPKISIVLLIALTFLIIFNLLIHSTNNLQSFTSIFAGISALVSSLSLYLSIENRETDKKQSIYDKQQEAKNNQRPYFSIELNTSNTKNEQILYISFFNQAQSILLNVHIHQIINPIFEHRFTLEHHYASPCHQPLLPLISPYGIYQNGQLITTTYSSIEQTLLNPGDIIFPGSYFNFHSFGAEPVHKNIYKHIPTIYSSKIVNSISLIPLKDYSIFKSEENNKKQVLLKTRTITHNPDFTIYDRSMVIIEAETITHEKVIVTYYNSNSSTNFNDIPPSYFNHYYSSNGDYTPYIKQIEKENDLVLKSYIELTKTPRN